MSSAYRKILCFRWLRFPKALIEARAAFKGSNSSDALQARTSLYYSLLNCEAGGAACLSPANPAGCRPFDAAKGQTVDEPCWPHLNSFIAPHKKILPA